MYFDKEYINKMSPNDFFYALVKEAQENNKKLVKSYKIASWFFLFIVLALVTTFIYVCVVTGYRIYAIIPPCIIPVSYMFVYNKRVKELETKCI